MGRPKKKLKGRKKSIKNDEEPVPVEPDQQEDQQHQTQAEPDHLEETENVRISTGQMSDKRVNDDEEPEGEVELDEDNDHVEEPKRKRKRGPTRMKDIAKDPTTRVRVDFTGMGEPYGEGSVKLSSYLGPLVREHVPVTVESWTKISEDVKTLLWRSVQARFELDENYQRNAVLTQMGCLWRSSKSRLVTKINEAKNTQQRMNLRPNNVSPFDWRRFVKLKTSQAFKAVSDSYKERRRKQIPHTCSRKGMVRLAEEMKTASAEPSQVSRLKVWVKSRTKKDGTPVNNEAAEKIKKATEILNSDSPSNATNEREDSLSQLLGPDNPGRMRAMGRNMSKTKLACLEVNMKCMTDMQQKQVQLLHKVNELTNEIARMKDQRESPEVGETSAARSVNKKSQPKCLLTDWAEDDYTTNVAEGRIISSDPVDLVNDAPLGPSDVKVLVETAIVPEVDLWRPTTNMFTIEEAVGKMVAWPVKNLVNLEQGLRPEENAHLDPTNSENKCVLLDLSSDDVVGEGRWETKEPKALVNGIPIGPKGVRVLLDVIHQPDTFLWRPTKEKSYLEDCLMSYVAWPTHKLVYANTFKDAKWNKSICPNSSSTEQSRGDKSAAKGHDQSTSRGSKSRDATSPAVGPKTHVEKSPTVEKSPARKTQVPSQSPTRRSPRKQGAQVIKENQKCMLMDIRGGKRIVAEGRVHSTDPEQKVHCVRLGANAARVWVDIVKIDDAAVWRPSDEMEIIKDALGSSIAWPMDKLVIF